MIFFITRKYPPHIGGIERFAFKLNKELQKKTAYPILAWGGRQWILPLFLPWAFVLACFYRLTGRMRCCYLADGVLAPLGWLIKLALRVPVVVTIHGRDIAFDLGFYQWIVPLSLRRADKVVCVSHFLKEECIKRGVEPARIEVIPNGVDPQDFAVKDIDVYRSQFEVMCRRSFAGKKLLLSVARLMPKKGIDVFLKNTLPLIRDRYKNFLYLIVGDGPLQPEIDRIIKENKLDEHALMLGKLAMASGELQAIYNICDLFIMPNVPARDDAEGFGIVALEAAISATPVVASKIDGILEAVKHGHNGVLIRHDDYTAFAEETVRLLKDDAARETLARSGVAFVKEHYAWPVIAEKYRQIFTALSSKHRPA